MYYIGHMKDIYVFVHMYPYWYFTFNSWNIKLLRNISGSYAANYSFIFRFVNIFFCWPYLLFFSWIPVFHKMVLICMFVCNLVSTCTTGATIMNWLENCLERKYMFHTVVLKGRFLYVGCASICRCWGVNMSLIHWLKMLATWEWNIALWCMTCVWNCHEI